MPHKPAPTPYPDLNTVLHDLAAGIRAILAGNFTGAYLQGSFAIGDFDRFSDCDFVVVVEEDLTAQQVHTLQTLHRRLYDASDHWGKHLEGSYFPREVLYEMAAAGRPLWYLDHGSRTFARSDHCNTIVVRATLRRHGVRLSGPPPASLIEPIPKTALQAEMRATMLDWGAEILAEPGRYYNRFYQSYLVLNYSRMLRDLRRGEVGSKKAAVAWARSHLDARWIDLVEWAWAFRQDPACSVHNPADPAAFERTLQFVGYVMDLAALEVTG